MIIFHLSSWSYSIRHLCKVTSCYTRSGFRSMSSKFKVFITNANVPREAVEVLKDRYDVDQWSEDIPITRNDLMVKIKGIDGLFCTLNERIDGELLDAAGPNLKVVGSMSVGLDHIDEEACKTRNIPIGYTPNVLTAATAELAVALLLATSRRIVEGTQHITQGTWTPGWKPLWMCGHGLDGSVLGIVGLGRIGYKIAECLKPFGVKQILYCGHKPKAYAEELPAKFMLLDEMLPLADFIVVSCSLSRETQNLFNRERFKKMKSSAIFINISRGGIVDQEALIEALTNKSICAAGLDVTSPEPLPSSNPLAKLDNCVILPHIGSGTYKSRRDMAMLTAQNIISALEGKEMPARKL